MLETAEHRDVTLLDVANSCRELSEELRDSAANDDVFVTPVYAARHAPASGCDSGFSTSDATASGKQGARKVRGETC